MKNKRLLCLVSLFFLLAPAAIHAQTTAFSFQGYLTENDAPATGLYDLQFSLFGGATGGNPIGGPLATNGVPVTNGLFTVFPDFGAAVFDGAPRWLDIRMRPNGGTEPYSVLRPRQQITPTPYAIYAAKAGSLSGSPTLTGTLTFSPPSGAPFLVGNPIKVSNLNADLLDGLDSSDFWKLTGNPNTIPSTHFLGTTDGRPLIIRATGGVGVGTTTPRGQLDVAGNIYWGTAVLRTDQGGAIELGSSLPDGSTPYIDFLYGGGVVEDYNVRLINNASQRLALVGSLDVTTEISVLNASSARSVIIQGDGRGHGEGWIGLYSSSGRTIELDADPLGRGNGWIGVYANNNRTIELDADGRGRTNGWIGLYNAAGGRTIELDADKNGSGRIITQVLQITGGSDLSERFDIIAPPETLKPGMVVCIDPERPGKLALSSKAYERTVAGVISGAGGVNVGMLMGQVGSEADGAHPVALTGRVYAWADATGNPIRPGDLLTTSEIPGHAMKVADHISAQGAVIGKAMTPLGHGTGLVLVLVSLQ